MEKTHSFQVHGFIHNEQLRIIDEVRAGGDFWLTIAVRVSHVDQTPRRLFQAGTDLSIGVESGVWLRRLTDARRGGFPEVFVPLVDGHHRPPSGSYATHAHLPRATSKWPLRI